MDRMTRATRLTRFAKLLFASWMVGGCFAATSAAEGEAGGRRANALCQTAGSAAAQGKDRGAYHDPRASEGSAGVSLPPGVAAAQAERAPRQSVAEELQEKLARIPAVEVARHATPIEFPAREARFVRLVIHKSSGASQPGIDELEIFGPDSEENLALSEKAAVATASSVIPGYAKHAVNHLNDGRYGNDYSWIAASREKEWVQIELPQPAHVGQVVISRDRLGEYRDRVPVVVEVLLSSDGKDWQSAVKWDRAATEDVAFHQRNPLCRYELLPHLPVARLAEKNWDGVLEYAFLREQEAWSRLPADDHLSPLVTDRPAVPGGELYWGRIARLEPLQRVLVLFEEMIERLGEKGLDVTEERARLAELREAAEATSGEDALDSLYLRARRAKRRLFFRDPDLAPLEQVLFSKRHPFLESHNYSEHLDSYFAPGGGVHVLHVPRDVKGRFRPARAEIEELFDGSRGIVREPVADYDARTIYFAYRPDKPVVEDWDSYWHLYAMGADGNGLQRLTDGPFHDFDAVVLPDGGIAFNTTRCTVRFLCWRPQAYVLYRMEADGTGMKRLSYSNLSEWKPSVMRDGRILWTRSEYLDKGADFGHTLWSIRPDGTGPKLVFGNNTPNCYSQAHEVPGTREIVCTLMSHGDHHGPIALIDRAKSPYDTRAITNITPDTRPQYQMSRSHHGTFRDPYPVSKDHFLVSHNPDNHHNFGLYVIDRYGNHELLYVDPEISSQYPRPLRPKRRPPVLAGAVDESLAKRNLGHFSVEDVYVGLEAGVRRGRAKYLRVAEELPAKLEHLPRGEFRDDHPPFTDFYASPVAHVNGPVQRYFTTTDNARLSPLRTGHNWLDLVKQKEAGLFEVTQKRGWPSYVAKTSHGTARIAEDGSANFLAPAGKVLYFQLLDEDYNEIQRMRSVIQLQPGEQRSCIGCHEDRRLAPPTGESQAIQRSPEALEPPPWDAEPFSYREVVQPVLDRQCVHCHDGGTEGGGLDLRGILDSERVPVSYRSLIEGGWVHYFDFGYGMRHFKAKPLSFGTVKSHLWKILEDENHREVSLEDHEMRAVKAWVDLNCPLWPDYIHRPDRPAAFSRPRKCQSPQRHCTSRSSSHCFGPSRLHR